MVVLLTPNPQHFIDVEATMGEIIKAVKQTNHHYFVSWLPEFSLLSIDRVLRSYFASFKPLIASCSIIYEMLITASRCDVVQ